MSCPLEVSGLRKGQGANCLHRLVPRVPARAGQPFVDGSSPGASATLTDEQVERLTGERR